MHLDPGDGGLFGVGQTDDGDLFAGFDGAAFDPAGSDGATTGDGEDVFYRHQERFVDVAFRGGDVTVYGVE